ncbi:LLM class flavin-dependent oxidoreductase [Aestuariivirga sp.]|jgi:alkanesulfonate monooxygenase SsuD/methylene tetrahydromethanopterin reductase-like flavin-dependent oxidoreductase (luciferase family)|uniref:LLM class flavin-dependent oxidoreductase n=1 Tax=Aestuariivirga sp. TaxID=2650926 RepID=UPI0037845BCB
MDFIHFLSSHMLDPSMGGKRLYKNVVAQAVHAEAVGYRGVGIPEHHLLNILLIPSPLQMAVKIAAHTKHILLVTSVCQLPIRDMRIFAGEAIQAQALCDGRLMLGVGKGAFGFETARFGVAIGDTKPQFDEDLKLLDALLTQEEVSWSSPRYSFPPLTIMPRPEDSIPLMVAVMNPAGIEAAAKAGYHVQTTPLGGNHQQLIDQVTAFNRGKLAAGRPLDTRLSLQRGMFLVASEKEKRHVAERAWTYYKSFDNVFGGPGLVDNGIIRPLPRSQTLEELAENLLLCGRQEMIDRLAVYRDLGIDEVLTTSNFGQDEQMTLDMMSRFAEEVMPHFRTQKQAA